MLNEGRYDSAIAESTEAMINEYGKELFRQLGIEEFSGNFTRANVIIEIREAVLQQDTRNTIHQIRWEQLEDQGLWPRVNARRISVRRVTSQTNVINGPTATTGETGYQKEEGRVNILLVIARSFEENNGQYYDIDPGITMSAILRIKRALEDNKSPHSIVLEVVRPGTFDAFKKHLKARPKGYFDIVHFDVHGRVTSEVNQNCKIHKSYLYFLHEDFSKRKPEDMKDNLVGVPARAIADELHLHQVPYAVLNACKSANPFGGNEGNLSRLFSKGNSLKILAMLYNISGAAIKLLCERFYCRFFKDLESFSDSASQARKDLRDYRVRIELYPRIEVQDWFVPVTYAHLEGGLAKSSKGKGPKWKKSSGSWLNVSSFSHSGIGTKSASSASSYVSSKSVGHDTSKFLALQIKPDLVFELQLMRDNITFLFGPSKIDNESYLGYVTDLWRITNFAEQPYEFECSHYMETSREVRELSKAREYIWGSCGIPPPVLPQKLVDMKTDCTLRPGIIFYQADALFPKKPSDKQLGRIRDLNNFLEEVLVTPAQKFGTQFRAPYLIFVSTIDIQSQSRLAFPRIGGKSFRYSGPAKTVPYS